MKPEDAYHQIDPANPALQPAPTESSQTPWEDETAKPTQTEQRYSFLQKLIAVTACCGFAAGTILLVTGGWLASARKQTSPSPSTPASHPPAPLTDAEIAHRISDHLSRFLKSDTTEEKLRHVAEPRSEAPRLSDYYETRGNRDAPLREIHLIRPVQIGESHLWVVSYTAVDGIRRNATFTRSGDDFLLNWASSYAYGELPWEVFANAQPTEPVAMRAYLLHYDGNLPPGYSAADWAAYVIEDKDGTFTELALMSRTSMDQPLIGQSPRGTRLPVHLELGYHIGSAGRKQLVIHSLIHFRWWNDSSSGKGI